MPQKSAIVAQNFLKLGDIAPDFENETSQGKVKFHAWKQDKWAVLFSHPADFTPVCTTELGTVAKYGAEWEKRNVKVIGLSCDDLTSHAAWIKDIDETQGCNVKFPIIADVDRKIATKYGMLDYQDADNVDKKGMPLTVRSVFVIDTKNVIRLIITYPASCGRNFDEILRVIDSLQLTDGKKLATPANWKQGSPVIIAPTVNNEDAKKMFPDFKQVKPYLRTTEWPLKK